MKIDHENHACVPIVGLDVLVAAVERLPESLHTRVEQVRHPATLLQANERPEHPPIVKPEALQLNEVPIADTGRYDQLGEKLSPQGHYCPMLRSGHSLVTLGRESTRHDNADLFLHNTQFSRPAHA